MNPGKIATCNFGMLCLNTHIKGYCFYYFLSMNYVICIKNEASKSKVYLKV